MISVRRLKTKFYPDPKRVIARFFMPGAERARSIVDKVIQLSENKVHSILNHVFEDFSERCRLPEKIRPSRVNIFRIG